MERTAGRASAADWLTPSGLEGSPAQLPVFVEWIIAFIAVGVVLGVFISKRLSVVSQARASELLRNGAVIVDVRSAREFSGRKVKGAINVPLGELKQLAPERLPDLKRPILVHCLGGGRSAIAKHQLKGMGYQEVMNLGSLGRAAAVAGLEPGTDV